MHFQLQSNRRLLDISALDKMHQTACDMLERIGMKVEHPEVLKEISRRPGFTLVESRVRITPAKTRALFVTPNPLYFDWDKDLDNPSVPLDFEASVSDRSSFIVERDGCTMRPMTRKDVIDGCKLLTVLRKKRTVHGATIGLPTDVPLALQPLEQFLLTAEYSPVGGKSNQDCDIPTAGIMADMNAVYGRPFTQSVWSPSPLTLGGLSLDIIWHYRDRITGFGVGSMPMMGVTGPCDPIACFTLAIAENLGAAAILHELLPHMSFSISPHPEPADMQTANIVFGTPEWDLIDIMHRDVFHYYGIPRTVKMLHTTQPLPSAQVMAEHSSSVMAGALAGFRQFHTLGQLSLDEGYSPALFMLDLDILDHVKRMTQGVFTGEDLELEGLTDLLEGAMKNTALFAEEASTVINMRKQYLQPKLFQRLNRKQWESAGRPDLHQQAYALADDLIKEYDYEPPKDKLAEIRKIYEKGKNLLLGN